MKRIGKTNIKNLEQFLIEYSAFNSRWSNERIADLLGMTPQAVSYRRMKLKKQAEKKAAK